MYWPGSVFNVTKIGLGLAFVSSDFSSAALALSHLMPLSVTNLEEGVWPPGKSAYVIKCLSSINFLFFLFITEVADTKHCFSFTIFLFCCFVSCFFVFYPFAFPLLSSPPSLFYRRLTLSKLTKTWAEQACNDFKSARTGWKCSSCNQDVILENGYGFKREYSRFNIE